MGATLSEWYEDQGRDAFMEYSLPMAAVRLAQAAGRLIRSETDRGIFTILDTRLKPSVMVEFDSRSLRSLRKGFDERSIYRAACRA